MTSDKKQNVYQIIVGIVSSHTQAARVFDAVSRLILSGQGKNYTIFFHPKIIKKDNNDPSSF